MSEDLRKTVYVQGSGTAKWDGVEYDLSQPVKVALGVANHWKGVGYSITITDAPEANVPPRDVENPLASDQGTAFAGLRRGRKPREG